MIVTTVPGEAVWDVAPTVAWCHVCSAHCTSPLMNLPRVICCCWACHSRYLAASKSVSMLIARKPSRQATRWPGTEGGKRPRGVGSVPVGSAVCTVHTRGPELSVPCVSPESKWAFFNPTELKVDPRIRKK